MDLSKSEAEPKQKEKLVIITSILLMYIFLFLYSGDGLYEYPLEAWIVDKFGEENFWIYSMFLILFALLNVVSILIAGSVSSKLDKKKRALNFST